MKVATRRLLEEQTAVDVVLGSGEKSDAMWHVPQYREHVSGVYSDHVAIFTDGSKTDQGVGAAAVAPNQTKTPSLPKTASVFTAKLRAINMALSIVEVGTGENYVIFTDSLSTLYSLTDCNTNNCISRRIQYKVHGVLNTE